MKTIKAFIKSHPLLSYFALTFAISWGGMLLVIAVGGSGGVPMLAWVAGPPIAGILLTGLLDGRAGFRDLLTRMRRWRVGARWYAVALLTAPLVFTAILLAFSLSSPEFLPRILTTSDTASVLLFGLGWGLIGGGFLEELGWTGFAVPTLLRRMRYGVLSTGLTVGLLWAVLHFLAFFYLGRSSGAIPLAIFVPLDVFITVMGMTAFRVLMVWVYDRSGGSLLVAGMLMHASYTAFTFILAPLTISGVAFLTVTFAEAAALWMVVAVVALVNHGHLTRQPPLRRRAA
jgi:membrane protease YdiL (CAAX protease family)